MFTTGYHGQECGHNTNMWEVSQDRTSQLFSLLRYKDDSEDDAEEDDDDDGEGDDDDEEENGSHNINMCQSRQERI